MNTYKVWMHIEELDEDGDPTDHEPVLPAQYGEYDTLDEAQDAVDLVMSGHDYRPRPSAPEEISKVCCNPSTGRDEAAELVTCPPLKGLRRYQRRRKRLHALLENRPHLEELRRLGLGLRRPSGKRPLVVIARKTTKEERP